MPANTPLYRYLDAFDESLEAVIDALQSGVQRSYRLSSTVLSEVQRGQREMLELGRAFAAEPTSVRAMYRRVRESAQRGRARRRELLRQVTDELAQSRTEARAIFSRLATQQRIADDATMQLARDVFNRIIDRAEGRLPRTTEQSALDAGASREARDGAPRSADGVGPDSRIPSSKAGIERTGGAGEPAPEWMLSSTATNVRASRSPSPQRRRRTDPVHSAG